ncbi:dihydrodipicolinate synthase family protein [Paracoccus suum]|uniref:Dihydrodipicolinate synthase family protein n=1 Tax=Paracoccus suum TaxID=2259340 RepID=A0A344PGC3_9RHOB|nr:dihydrodipicolinate synthase family protein [Paracoccus suum]AXC48428.1 dihydrodipicolinate synthase family protein [Paracoccus suum]
MTSRPQVLVPLVTPFRPDLSVDRERLVTIGKRLIADGADGLAPFGTTSEANSLSVSERIDALEALVAGGIDPAVLVPGTGCAALPDTIALTRHAVSLGVRGTLTLPPFYYKPVSDDGLAASFARVIEAAGPALRLYMYHIPQTSGVPVTANLIARLREAFPGMVVGLKDSSGNWDNTAAMLDAFPEMEIFSSSESLLPRNVAAGGAGCISATANVNAHGIAALIRGLGTPDEARLLDAVTEVRRRFEGPDLIPAIKAAVARRMNDPEYARTRPPLVAMDTAAPAIAEAAALAGGVNEDA